MQKLSTAFKVGFVILVGILVTVIMIIRFSASWGNDADTYQLKAYFNDATGLAVRSKIMIAGIQVGEVESIRLDGARALVTFRVRDDIQIYKGVSQDGYEKNGATVSKQLSGILGDYHLELTPGIAGDVLQNGDFIPNVLQENGIDSVIGSAGKILQDVSAVTDNLATVMGGKNGEQRLAQLVEDLGAVMRNLKTITDENAAGIRKIVDNLDTVSQYVVEIAKTGNEEIPQLAGQLSELINEARETLAAINGGVSRTMDTTQGSIEQLKVAIEKLDNTLGHIEKIAKNVEDGNGTVGKLFKDDGIANEAQALLTETRELIQQGTKTVEGANSLIAPLSKLDVDISLRGDYMANQNAFKVDFGVRLQPSFDKYYYLGLVLDPNGTTKKKSILTDSTATGSTYETVITNDDSVKFNLQYARRWRWFTGRFGLIENTGGLGGDMQFFDDDLKFSFDLFAFNDNEYPRIRGTMLLYWSLFIPYSWAKTFYLSAGFDDPLNRDVFDYFFGIGFRFSDNDIKSLMTIVPTP